MDTPFAPEITELPEGNEDSSRKVGVSLCDAKSVFVSVLILVSILCVAPLDRSERDFGPKGLG